MISDVNELEKLKAECASMKKGFKILELNRKKELAVKRLLDEDKINEKKKRDILVTLLGLLIVGAASIVYATRDVKALYFFAGWLIACLIGSSLIYQVVEDRDQENNKLEPAKQEVRELNRLIKEAQDV